MSSIIIYEIKTAQSRDELDKCNSLEIKGGDFIDIFKTLLSISNFPSLIALKCNCRYIGQEGCSLLNKFVQDHERTLQILHLGRFTTTCGLSHISCINCNTLYNDRTITSTCNHNISDIEKLLISVQKSSIISFSFHLNFSGKIKPNIINAYMETSHVIIKNRRSSTKACLMILNIFPSVLEDIVLLYLLPTSCVWPNKLSDSRHSELILFVIDENIITISFHPYDFCLFK